MTSQDSGTVLESATWGSNVLDQMTSILMPVFDIH